MATAAKDDSYLYEARLKILENVQAQDTKIADILEQCRAQIARAERTKQELRAQYNVIAPISRLPAEVIAAVFEIYVSRFQMVLTAPAVDNGDDPSPPRWLRILHVCREWRHIALSTPRLWTCIWPVHSDYIQFAIAHSGLLPLDIPVWSLVSRKRVALHAVYPPILRELSRVRIAHFNVNKALCKFLSTVEDSIDLEAPMLLELDITMRRSEAHIPVLSKLGMPQLGALTLWDGSLPLLKTFIRSTLTILIVNFMPWVLPSALADVLQELPLLQRLTCNGLGSDELPLPRSPDRSLPSWHRKIDLPHLKHLSFEGEPSSLEAAQLLDCLTFPVNAAIEFCSYSVGANELVFKEQYAYLLPIILSKIQVSDPLSPSVRFRPRVIFVKDFLDLTMWSALRPEDIDADTHHDNITVQRLKLSLQTFKAKSLIMLFELLDLSELIVLDVDRWERGYTGTWRRILEHNAWPRLETLRLPYNRASIVVLSALGTPHVHEGGNFLVPALHTIEIRDYDPCGHSHDPLDSQRRIHLRILALLRARADGGHRIERLVLSGVESPAPEAEMMALRDVCGTLEIRHAVIHTPVRRPAFGMEEDTEEEQGQEGDGKNCEYWDEGEQWDFDEDENE